MCTLYLHIGIFKTGTTALQYYLAENAESLKKKGVLYVGWRDSGFSTNHAFLADPLMHREIGEAQTFFRLLEKEYQFHKSKSALVSAEGLYFPDFTLALTEKRSMLEYPVLQMRHDYVELLHSLIPACFTTKIVIYLRRQDLFLESMYKQVVRGVYTYEKEFQDFLTEFYIMADYAKMLRIWGSVFGPKNIIVRIYDDKLIRKGIINDFCSTILKNHDCPNRDFVIQSPLRRNKSLTRDFLEYKKIANSQISSYSHLERTKMREAFTRLSAQYDETDCYSWLLDPAQRRLLLARYQDGNKEVAQQYFEDGRETLFTDPLPSIESYHPYPGLSLEKAIDIGVNLWKMSRDMN